MHPHRGVAAPSLHPQSQHVGPHNSPNKRERRVGPSCASCGPWTLEVRWETILAHLNCVKERATVPGWRTGASWNRCALLSSLSAHVGSGQQVNFGGAADSFRQEKRCSCSEYGKFAEILEIKSPNVPSRFLPLGSDPRP